MCKTFVYDALKLNCRVASNPNRVYLQNATTGLRDVAKHMHSNVKYNKRKGATDEQYFHFRIG
ncbi:MAG: hypothetical protein NVS4B8_02710 [Herpetosiphon sp.]